jgi:hypothetical protein
VSTGLRAGQLADAAGVNVETLRYYERRGIIPQPERSPGGHRMYSDATVTTLRVIKAAQRLGRHRHGAVGLSARTETKLVEVDQKISDLQTIRASLVAARDAGCDDLLRCAESECCPIPFAQIATRP